MKIARYYLLLMWAILFLVSPAFAQARLTTVVLDDHFDVPTNTGEIAKGWNCWPGGAQTCPRREVLTDGTSTLLVNATDSAPTVAASQRVDVTDTMRRGGFTVTTEVSTKGPVSDVPAFEPQFAHLGVAIYVQIVMRDGTLRHAIYYPYYPVEAEDWNTIGFFIPSGDIDHLLIVVGVVRGQGSASFRNVTILHTPPRDTGLVTIMFDDSNLSAKTVAYQIMKQANMVGSLAITTAWLGQPNRLTEADLIFLFEMGWDIVSHGHTHADAVKLLKEKGTDALYAELAEVVAVIQRILKIPVPHHATPYGSQDGGTQSVTDLLHYSQRSYASGENYAGVFPKMIHVFQYKRATTVAEVRAALEKVRQGAWVIFVVHDITATQGDYDVTPQQFQDLIDDICSYGIKAENYEMALREYSPYMFPLQRARVVEKRMPLNRPTGRKVGERVVGMGRAMTGRIDARPVMVN